MIKKIHVNIIQHLKIVIAAHQTYNTVGGYTTTGYSSGGYSSAGGDYFSDAGYESGGSQVASSLSEGKLYQLPIDLATKIMESTNSHELLEMLLKEIYRSYDKLGKQVRQEEQPRKSLSY